MTYPIIMNISIMKYNYTPRERSSGGYIEITLSVRLSVCLSVCPSVLQIRVRPITFLWFDIGLPYLAHGCITMRQCVAYIHDPDTTLNFDLKVKFIGFFTCFRVRPITFFWITLAYHIWHKDVSPSDNVSHTFMIPIQCWPLTSRSNLKAFVMSSCTICNSVSFDIGLPYLAHGCITMRQCVSYIHDPDTTLERNGRPTRSWQRDRVYLLLLFF